MGISTVSICATIFLAASLATAQTSQVPSIKVSSGSALGRMVEATRIRGESSVQVSLSTAIPRRVNSLAEMIADSWVVVAIVRESRTTIDHAQNGLTTWDRLEIIKTLSPPPTSNPADVKHSLGLPSDAFALLSKGPVVFYAGGTAVIDGVTVTQEAHGEKLVVGQTYLLFLTPTGYEPNTFFFQFGGESVFRVLPDGHLEPTKGYRFAIVDKELATICHNSVAGVSKFVGAQASQQKR